ncbi:MAG: hypothetical protein AAF193_01575 [Bacteroidota bacterium]
MMTSDLPNGFIQRIKSQFPEHSKEILAGFHKDIPTTIQHHWSSGFVNGDNSINPNTEALSERPIFPLDPKWHAGAYYVQEGRSQMLYHAVCKAIGDDEQPKVLDLCAAPGGKSINALNVLKGRGVVWSNEVMPKRYQILKENLIKWGDPNIVLSQNQPRDLLPLSGLFDLVMVDAPCSGEGMFRKDPGAVSQWHPGFPHECAILQEQILDVAMKLVKEGGHLLYSTCTLAEIENDAQVRRLKESGFEEVPLNLPQDHQLPSKWGAQYSPGMGTGEGLYHCLLQKSTPSNALSKGISHAVGKKRSEQLLKDLPFQLTDQGQTRLYERKGDLIWLKETVHELLSFAWESKVKVQFAGVNIATLKGKHWVPHPHLAFQKNALDSLDRIDLIEEEALAMLRLADPKIQGMGWKIARYQGFGLGLLKCLGTRNNNYYPKNWRLRL